MTQEVDEFFNRFLDQYSTCTSYRDLGKASGERGVFHFRTLFVRPDKFKFEWTLADGAEGEYLNVLCVNGEDVYYRRHGKVDVELPFDVALGGAGGASQGVADFVPCLLMPDLISSVIKLGAPYGSPDLSINQSGLIQLISNAASTQRQVKLWIDADTLVLRKAVIEYSLQFTAAQAQQQVNSLVQIHPEMQELLPKGNPPAIDKVATVEIEWENVSFDSSISLNEFSCENP
ncbi:MAG: hypothetical protein IT342_02900 [Candidatus Melainabacteria bacterium]|nr:hypothetical protein [Candidatus Melainabacteria bacterium]